MGVIGPGQVILIVAIILLFWRTKFLSSMRGLGEGIREFKKASKLEKKF
jgi:Sec-independent protein translocase protein TatA